MRRGIPGFKYSEMVESTDSDTPALQTGGVALHAAC